MSLRTRLSYCLSTMIAVISFACAIQAQSQPSEPLRLEATITLPGVKGRIDHMSIDASGGRLFVSALGNDTLEVIDVKNNRRLHSIAGLAEPQGVLFVSAANRIFVANARDGSVHIFDASTFAPIKVVSYDSDPDNVRYDTSNGHIWVGYGEGALGELDKDGNKLADIKLDAHPESFQLETRGSRIFVNLPDSRKIGVVDRAKRSSSATWHTGGPLSNFPMALDEPDHRLFIVCRRPARFIVLDAATGQRVASLPAVGDCDDLFFDAKWKRIYAIGGEGAVSVFQQESADHYTELARIQTRSGARTGYFSPDLDRLYVALRRMDSAPAEIRVYAPQ